MQSKRRRIQCKASFVRRRGVREEIRPNINAAAESVGRWRQDMQRLIAGDGLQVC